MGRKEEKLRYYKKNLGHIQKIYVFILKQCLVLQKIEDRGKNKQKEKQKGKLNKILFVIWYGGKNQKENLRRKNKKLKIE